MKKTVLFLCLLAAAALGQEPVKPAEAAKPAEETKPAQETTPAEETKPEEQPASNEAAVTPAATPEVTGSVEIGYRFLGDIHGNNDVYRSVVNLGEGPRLVNLNLMMTPSLKWIDDLKIGANSWGGDPYNTAYIRAGKQGAYRLTVDYRNIAYFSSLPSFANPNLERGLLESQRTFDTVRRFAEANLELRPGKRIVPFLSYMRNSGSGRGVTLYVPSFNEYAVPTDLRDSSDTYRAGVSVQMNRFHLTVQQGLFYFKDDQRVYEQSPLNPGNRQTPYFGQQLMLRNLQQAYGVRGDGWFTQVYGSGNPASWLDLTGSYIHTQADYDTNYQELATGLFAQSPPLGFFSTQQALYNSVANRPHDRATFGAEVRPHSRIRILESFYLDRLDTTGNANGTLIAGTQPGTATNIAGLLKMNYYQNQVEALVDITKNLTLRGGHRYTWGDSDTLTSGLTGVPGTQTSELRRNTGLAGVIYRPVQKVSINLDAEIASTDRAYFRTSLMDYQKYRARVRYSPTADWSFTWNGSVLNNDTPNSAVVPRLGDYDLVTIDNAFAFFWTPKGGDRIRAMAEYARQSWRSDILYLVPQGLFPERSEFRENVNAANFLVDISPRAGWSPRLSAGGSLFRSSGSRPTQFYQPLVRVAIPTVRRVELIGEWRWWSMAEPLYPFENFRNHQGMISLRIWQ